MNVLTSESIFEGIFEQSVKEFLGEYPKISGETRTLDPKIIF